MTNQCICVFLCKLSACAMIEILECFGIHQLDLRSLRSGLRTQGDLDISQQGGEITTCFQILKRLE